MTGGEDEAGRSGAEKAVDPVLAGYRLTCLESYAGGEASAAALRAREADT